MFDYKLDEGNIRAMGVGCREGELKALQEISNLHGVSRNAVMRFAIRWFIEKYKDGEVDLTRFVVDPPIPRKKLVLP